MKRQSNYTWLLVALIFSMTVLTSGFPNTKYFIIDKVEEPQPDGSYTYHLDIIPASGESADTTELPVTKAQFDLTETLTTIIL